ncbi:MAG TPA: phage terminase large subunit [Treponemataceae bacterium]|nr:phage terminase large subunit [Treponemataceae bacterium]
MVISLSIFRPTKVQQKALELLKGSAKHILLFGGSRSGKTTVLVMAIIYRACKYNGSRHLICRYRAKDARSSVLHETLVPWLKKTVGEKNFKLNVHDGFIQLWNGSEIWIGGLGDKEQVDKILGHEYNTIYFNEVSQITYSAITTAYSRLAMHIEGCKNRFFYDCNPASPMHWAYKVFIRKLEPRTDEALERPTLYDSMVLNPADNVENLAEDYIDDILDNLPEKQKARFKDGLWVKAEGVVYEKFEESMILSDETMPSEFEYYTAGQDFGLNIAGVKIGWKKNLTGLYCVYIIADNGGFNITTQTFVEQLTSNKWYEEVFVTYCDPAGGERIQEIPGGVKANNSVDAGIDYISALIERKRFFVSKSATGVLGEIWDYSRDENNQIVKVNDHYMDAMRYGIFSAVTQGIVLN